MTTEWVVTPDENGRWRDVGGSITKKSAGNITPRGFDASLTDRWMIQRRLDAVIREHSDWWSTPGDGVRIQSPDDRRAVAVWDVDVTTSWVATPDETVRGTRSGPSAARRIGGSVSRSVGDERSVVVVALPGGDHDEPAAENDEQTDEPEPLRVGTGEGEAAPRGVCRLGREDLAADIE